MSMENEIEEKRRKLENDIGQIAFECGQKNFEIYGLEMFNLGVELARKEFLVRLERELGEDNYSKWDCDSYEHLLDKLIEEIKEGGEK